MMTSSLYNCSSKRSRRSYGEITFIHPFQVAVQYPSSIEICHHAPVAYSPKEDGNKKGDVHTDSEEQSTTGLCLLIRGYLP